MKQFYLNIRMKYIQIKMTKIYNFILKRILFVMDKNIDLKLYRYLSKNLMFIAPVLI